jgi:hypothetical protein
LKPRRLPNTPGERFSFEDVVAIVHTTAKGVPFINLGEAYPIQIFSGFISVLSTKI